MRWHSRRTLLTYAAPRGPTTGAFYVQAPKGGAQGNALMGLASVLTIDSVLKFTESKFKGVNVRAAHDDITTVGPPHIIAGTDGVPEALLGGLAEVGTGPQFTKFQAPGTTEEAPADKPEWLPAP
jgi:hypothetical protein